jgi:hypothetical protein
VFALLQLQESRRSRLASLFIRISTHHRYTDIKILLCLIKDSSNLYSLMFSFTRDRSLDALISLEQFRDLYERIPFARGPARVALLHRLRRVTTEVRKARASSSRCAALKMARQVGPGCDLAADTARR